jgi:hypothetical protein
MIKKPGVLWFALRRGSVTLAPPAETMPSPGRCLELDKPG